MKAPESESQQNIETLEHLLGVVLESREKRCAELRGDARVQAEEIVKQAHKKSRARMHRHVSALREKYRVNVASARARNQTLVRQQQQKVDQTTLDSAWPLLREALLGLWKDSDSRRKWLNSAISSALSSLRECEWQIEHPPDFSTEEQKRLRHKLAHNKGVEAKLIVREDIEAGIRISAQGTVVDATLDGLLHQKLPIEAKLIARIKLEASGYA